MPLICRLFSTLASSFIRAFACVESNSSISDVADGSTNNSGFSSSANEDIILIRKIAFGKTIVVSSDFVGSHDKSE